MVLVLSPQSKVAVTRINDGYCIKVELDNESYIHHHSFVALKDAVELGEKILRIGKIDLRYWSKDSQASDIEYKFLIHYRKKKCKAHLWSGLDTLCAMWSTGGLGYDYDLFNTTLNRNICTMCSNTRKARC